LLPGGVILDAQDAGRAPGEKKRRAAAPKLEYRVFAPHMALQKFNGPE
jgi:hypothetical protein